MRDNVRFVVECFTRLGFVNDSRRVVKNSIKVSGEVEVKVDVEVEVRVMLNNVTVL